MEPVLWALAVTAPLIIIGTCVYLARNKDLKDEERDEQVPLEVRIRQIAILFSLPAWVLLVIAFIAGSLGRVIGHPTAGVVFLVSCLFCSPFSLIIFLKWSDVEARFVKKLFWFVWTMVPMLLGLFILLGSMALKWKPAPPRGNTPAQAQQG